MSHNTPEERACQATNAQGITPETLNTILAEVGANPIVTPVSKVIDACNQSTDSPAKKKSIAESKKLIETCNAKMSKYPKYLSYEGSVVLCVIISIGETQCISLSGLPEIDRELIVSQLPMDSIIKIESNKACISIEFDDIKDFILTYTSSNVPIKLSFFNSVIHPQKQPGAEVPVEQDGDTFKIGSTLVLDQKRIQKLVGQNPQKNDEEPPRRQPISGRNAFELRTDILTLAADWVRYSGHNSEVEVMRIAKLFYSFVENKR